MKDVIRLLPDPVANQIAAGEVIQRPAAVVKELVENAVDAGATTIKVYIKDAGKTLIQVIDNGIGMTETDARMAFERHATSKISLPDDLFHLTTMGFRGEALPSICAISEVELRTRTADMTLGTRLVIEASKVREQEQCVCDVGTSLSVKRLFWNVPARRRFLKSDSVELSNIMREFERLALVNNNLHLYINTGNREIDLQPASLKQRINDIWKNNLNMHLLPVEIDTDLVKISGYVSRPEYARRRNPLQFLIVNGRNMRHPYFHKAILNCFAPLIASDMQPCYFIKFEVDPERIDVNIHPTKNEIKFSDEQQIWSILTAAVRSTLGRNAAVPSIDFESEVLPVASASDLEKVPADFNPFSDRYHQPDFSDGKKESFRRVSNVWKPTTASKDWHKLYEGFIDAGAEMAHPDEKQSELPVEGEDVMPEQPLCFQYARKYIITASDKDIIVIDQHRAHVKILYERFMQRAKSLEAASQNLLFPDYIELDASQQLALEGVEDELHRLGFKIEYESDNRWAITSVPTLIGNKDPKEMILRVIDSVCDDSATYGSDGEQQYSDSLLQRAALVMARGAAIERGTVLSSKEMEHIIAELFSLSSPTYSPNGNPVVRVIDESRIESLFA